MENRNFGWSGDSFSGLLFGVSILLMGFGMGGGTFAFPSVPAYLLLAIVMIAVAAGVKAKTKPAWFFYPTFVCVLAVMMRCFLGGGGSWVGWQDLIVLGGGMSYFVAARMGGSREFLRAALVPLTALGLGSASVVFLQASGGIDGHPLWWLAPAHLPRVAEGGNYISGILPTRTASSALLSATALMITGYALWGKVSVGWRICAFWAGGVMLVAALLCQSRAGVMGLAAGCVWMTISSLVVAGRYKSRVIWCYFLGLGGGIAAVLTLFYLLFASHLGVRGRVLTLLEDPYRLVLWSETIFRIDPDKFFWGLGPGKYHLWSKGFSGAGTGGDPVFLHNDWIQFALEYGWPAGILLAVLLSLHALGGIFMTGRSAGRMGATWNWPKSTYLGGKVGSGAALVSLGVHAFFDYPMHMPVVAVVAGFVAGICAVGEAGKPPGRVFKVFMALGGGLLLVGLAAVFFKHIGGDFLSWRAEQMALGGDGRGAWNLLSEGSRDPRQEGRDYHLARGGIALQLAKTAEDAIERGRFARDAGASYAEILRIWKDDPDALRGAGVASLFLGDYGRAEGHLRGAVGASPNSPRAYEWLGFCLEAQGRVTEARKAYKISIQLGEAPIATTRLKKLEPKATNAP